MAMLRSSTPNEATTPRVRLPPPPYPVCQHRRTGGNCLKIGQTAGLDTHCALPLAFGMAGTIRLLMGLSTPASRGIVGHGGEVWIRWDMHDIRTPTSPETTLVERCAFAYALHSA